MKNTLKMGAIAMMVGVILTVGTAGTAKASVYDETTRLQGEIDALTVRVTALEGVNAKLQQEAFAGSVAPAPTNDETRISALETRMTALENMVAALRNIVVAGLQQILAAVTK